MGIKIANSLPFYIKDLSHNSKQIILVLRNFLYSKYVYTTDILIKILSEILVGYIFLYNYLICNVSLNLNAYHNVFLLNLLLPHYKMTYSCTH
jgi:hypothetical protein